MIGGPSWGRALLVFVLASTAAPAGADHTPGHAASSPAEAGLLDALGLSSGGASTETTFLHPEVAFVLSAELRDAGTVVVRWDIRPGYYLYRHRFSFTSTDETVARLGAPRFSPGEFKEDPYFGRQEVYYEEVEAEIPLLRSRPDAADLALEIGYQGCADAGLCYPPTKKTVPLALPAAGRGAPGDP